MSDNQNQKQSQLQTRPETREKKNLIPTENKIQISLRKNNRHFAFLSKLFLSHFETVELHALGEATKIAVAVSEQLKSQDLVSIVRCETKTVVPDQQGQGNNQKRKIKIIVTLKRAEGFLEKTKGFLKNQE